jgi:flagellar hook-associated protein 2
MAAISFSGLSSGLDTDAIINALVGVERLPMLRLQSQNGALTQKKGVVDKLSSALASLRTAAQSLGSTGDVLSYKGKVGNDAVASMTVSGDAVPGSYALEVTNLAQAQRSYSEPFGDADAALSASAQTLTLSIGGVDTDIELAANASLRDVAAAINSAGIDARAGLMFDGTDYRLQVVGTRTGADQAITFTDTGLGLGLADNRVQQALDAVFSLDGYPMTSSDNVIDDALPGVTLELTDDTVGFTDPVQLTISADPTAVKSKVKAFVDAYNAVASLIQAQSGQGKGEETLNGDSTVRSIEQGLGRLISSPISGLENAAGYSLQLSDLGIETQRDGTLTLDDDDLDEALAADFAQVAKYFTGDATNDGIATLLSDAIDSYIDGSDSMLEIRKDGISDVIELNDKRIADLEAYLERFEANLQQQFTLLESTMSEIKNQGDYLARFLNS